MFNLNRFNNLPELVKNYLFYLTTIKNRSVRTAYAYAVDLKNFFRFYKLHKNLVDSRVEFALIDVKDIDLDLIKKIKLIDVYEYFNFLMLNKNNEARARARKTSALKGFFNYLKFNLKLLSENPIENLDSPKWKNSLPKYMSLEECTKLLKTQAKSLSKTKFRDYCILTLFLNCGMRLSELEGINLKNLKLDDSSLRLLGKGNKERIIFLNKACVLAVKNYLKNERSKFEKIKNTGALFLSSTTGRRLCARQIQKIVDKALNLAGLSNLGYSVHKLRHTAATLLYQHSKVDILILKEMLGHSNVGTTQIYTHVANSMLKKAMQEGPLSKLKK